MSPRGHRTQGAEQRPVSSVNWHRTVKHLLAHDTRADPDVVRSFLTVIKARITSPTWSGICATTTSIS
jgi:hypothetical protein